MAMLAAIMTATLFLSFVVLVIGFIAADGLHRLCFVFGRAWPSVAILSFGGIPRQRAHKGGLLLVFSSVLVLLPLSVVGAWPSGAGASMMLIGVAVLGRLRRRPSSCLAPVCATDTDRDSAFCARRMAGVVACGGDRRASLLDRL